MILRKRAWDLMRQNFTRVTERTRLGDAIGRLRQSLRAEADNDLLVAVDDLDRLVGVVSIRRVMKDIESCILSDERVRDAEATNWDKAFGNACEECCLRRVGELLNRKPPTVKPGDPLLLVIDIMTRHDTRWAVVVEGEKPLGVVFVGDVFREIAREMAKER